MKYKIDCEHIFYDRFEIVDKESIACDIVGRVIKDKGTINDDVFLITGEYDEELDLLFDLLKREFFIRLIPIEEAREVISEAEQMEKYICDNFHRDALTIDEICSHVHMERGRADKAMKNKFGMTVSAFLRRRRTEASCKMLLEGKKVEECRILCGFGSIESMRRAFKELLGVTPGEYRERGRLDSKGAK